MKTLRRYADGRILSGKEAKKLNLIDKLGNIQDAILEAKKLAGLEKKKVLLIEIKPKPPLLEKLLGTKIQSFIPYSGLYYLMSL